MRYLRWLLLLVFLLVVCALAVSVDAACWCGGSTVNFREVDGTPFGSYHTVIVPNDTLNDNGDQTATFAPSGSGNVSNSGTPLLGQACEWVNATTVQGVNVTGTGDYVRAIGPTISWGDGLRQTFNPNATTPGINVGSQAGDPSTPVNGDLWYDSTANELTARINGANVALGAGGAGGAPTDAQYWTARTEGGLSAEVSLGALTSGLLKHTVTGGVSTPATAVVGTDYVSPASAASWGDGVKQTFNPNATNAGLNVGSQAGDPSSLANGDLWYDSTANELTARINGANVALGAAGAGGVTLTGAETLSNKKIIPRKTALSASSGTVTAPNCDVAGSDTYFRDDIAGALTIPAATGTCHDGQRLLFELKPATAQQPVTFTTGVSKGFSAQAGLPLPTTTGDSTTYVLYAFIYKAATDRLHYVGGTAAATVRSIYFSAGSMEVSGGCAAIAPAALVTNGPKLPTIGCTDNDADSIEFDVVMPDGWDGGTITIELVAFSIGNNTTEVFEMDFAGQCVSSGDTPTAHSTTGEQAATITWGNTANREQHATTTAITINGACAAGDHLYMRGQVDATATTMTPMSDLKILGAKLEYARSGGND